MKSVFSLAYLILIGVLASCAGGSALPQASIPAPALTAAYPTDLAIASPYAVSGGASGSLSLIKQMNKALLNDPGASYQEKIEHFTSILEATSVDGCSFSLNLDFTEDSAACYGPEIEYTGHPDTPFGGNANGRLPTGDLGLWDELDADGNACAAAEMNALFSNVSGQVDSALGFFASMICVANNNDISPPDESKSTDLTQTLQDAFTSSFGLNVTVANASIARAADTAEGDPVYEMAITGSDPAGNSLSFSLTHIPLDAGNDTYRGKLAFSISNDSPGFGINCGGETGTTSAASILYEKTSATSLAYSLNRADFCGTNVDPFDANDDIDPTDKFQAGVNANGWANNYNRVVINLNPESGASTVSYAWQAGANDGNTRVFLGNVAHEDTNALESCSYYGFGPDIEDAETNTIDGFICNWTGPGAGGFGDKDMVDKVQRQCVTQNDDGLFESDTGTLNIAYAPTNSCDSSGGGFVFDGISGAFTNDLLDLGQMDFTDPTAPTEI